MDYYRIDIIINYYYRFWQTRVNNIIDIIIIIISLIMIIIFFINIIIAIIVADDYCNLAETTPYYNTGLNPYDIKKECGVLLLL